MWCFYKKLWCLWEPWYFICFFGVQVVAAVRGEYNEDHEENVPEVNVNAGMEEEPPLPITKGERVQIVSSITIAKKK